MKQKLTGFIVRNEVFLPLLIFLLFLAASIPGVNWGAPALWNPDELIWRVDMALGGDMQFDVTEPDFNYPSLPKYVMYAIGAVTYGMGKSSFAFIVAARLFSAFLGAMAGVLIYYLARMIGADKWTAALAGILYTASGVAAANGRFAHNDLYLQLFAILCVYFVVKYQFTNSKMWLYASFFSVGLAASSKYTGISMVLLPLGVFVFMNWSAMSRDWLRSLETLFIGGVLVILGYGIGTPRLFLSPVDYLQNVVPAALRFSQYGFNSGTPIGLYGQWAVFKEAVGTFVYYLYMVGFVWFAIRLLLRWRGKARINAAMVPGILILMMNVMLFDLPFLISINYIPRHFIPFIPPFTILGALFVEEIIHLAKGRNLKFVQPAIITLLVIGITYSLLRLVSIALLFVNDARIPAGEYIGTIRGYGKSIEYTLYPPVIEKKRFARAHNYPIYFVKYADDAVPTGGRYEYNQGEQGLLERQTDLFVIDSYTYLRFYTDSVCVTNLVECNFFKQLLAGENTNFRLVKKYAYSLPPYLPRVTVSSVNPDILIFEQIR